MPKAIAGFDEVLKDELSELRERRKQIFDVKDEDETGDALAQAHRFKPLGMGLSGGGIRSATFNLGILQGLASRGLLPYIDYLSTVSGGGYIGTWLHAVILRKHGGNPRLAGERLDPARNPVPGQAEDDPVTFLRKYSNYLAPKPGLFRPDFWAILVIWFRNMLLNQLILVPFLAGVVLIALLTGYFIKPAPRLPVGIGVATGAFGLLVWAIVNAAKNLRSIAARTFEPAPPRIAAPAGEPRRIASWPSVVSVLIAALLIFCLHCDPFEKLLPGIPNVIIVFLALMFLFWVFQTLGGFRTCYGETHKRKSLAWVHVVWMASLAAAVTSAMLAAVMYAAHASDKAWHPVIWGPPAMVLALGLGVSFHIGLMGADFPDACREWLARVGAQQSIVSVGWLALLGLAVYGPFGMAWLAVNYGPAAVAAILAWAASTFFGVRAGASPRTSGVSDDPHKSNGLEWITKLAPAVFMIGFLILIAGACHYALGASATNGYCHDLKTAPAICSTAANTGAISPATFDFLFKWLQPFVKYYQAVLDCDKTADFALLLLLICAAMTLVFPLRFNINEFSMHHFFKNRLVRCYLGAGNARDRHPNRFTGFDSKDDLPIAELTPSSSKKYLGPYAIVNTTLNLNAGSELAQQERKAASFVFTPKYCGFDPPHSREDRDACEKPGSLLEADGYCRTEGFFNPSGPDIGTAMGISGAAANPNAGYHTSAPVAFLLTLFDVRLGWWLGNPRIDCRTGALEGLGQCPRKRPGPLYGLAWLIWELLGQTKGTSRYVNLSDGGHFDNLGLYELVRRRCRYIIIGDGEQDERLTFESLGGAIRKCRADFGVEIDIDVEQIRAAAASQRTHCVVGTIIYPEKDADRGAGTRVQGSLLYFKAGLTGDEPEDVKQYHASHPEFPHQSTLDQFFTESQFESYRCLGLHAVESVFENVKPPHSPHPASVLEELFKDLRDLWYPPSNMAPGVATKRNEEYSALMKRLSDDADLAFLDGEIVLSPQQKPGSGAKDEAARRKAFFVVVELIQIMENVWFDFNLDRAGNRNNPKNQGWMSIFRRWVKADMFPGVWGQVRANYNPLFQDFVDKL